MNALSSRLLLALLLLMSTGMARADLFYQLSIDTTSLAGSQGYLELSLGGLTEAPSAALHSHLLHDVMLGSVVEQFGQISGSLSDALVMASDMGFADLLQQLQFGDSLALQLQFSGAWLNALSDTGLTFAIKLWSTDFVPLLGPNELGDLLRLELIPGGHVQLDIFSEYVTVQPLAIPLPTGVSLILLGLVMMALLRLDLRQHSRRQRN